MLVMYPKPITDIANAISTSRKEIPLVFPEPSETQIFVAYKIYEDLIPDVRALAQDNASDTGILLSAINKSNKPPQILEALAFACWFLSPREGRETVIFRELSVDLYK